MHQSYIALILASMLFAHAGALRSMSFTGCFWRICITITIIFFVAIFTLVVAIGVTIYVLVRRRRERMTAETKSNDAEGQEEKEIYLITKWNEWEEPFLHWIITLSLDKTWQRCETSLLNFSPHNMSLVSLFNVPFYIVYKFHLIKYVNETVWYWMQGPLAHYILSVVKLQSKINFNCLQLLEICVIVY